MTYEFEYLMHLLAAAARGTPALRPEKPISWDTLFTLAEQQQILPLIVGVVKKNPALCCPGQILAPLISRTFSTVLTDCARRGSVIALLEDMENAGMHAYVAKGMVAAANYAMPEKRISCDVDLFIDPAQEEQVCRFLRQRGCAVSPRWENGHHATARHPGLGLLEVHVRLYDELVEEVWFRNADPAMLIREPQRKVITDDGEYYTLGPTDHLIFMTLHMIKHFISRGMSARMMMDVAMQIVKHRDELDLDRLWKVLDSLNYTHLMDSILWGMIHYCGFCPEDFPGLGSCCTDHVMMIMEDVETGGWMGKMEGEIRAQSAYLYNRRLMLREKSEWQYRLYMLQWTHSFKLRTLFPNRERMAQQYPWVEKQPWLMPFAWLHRILFRGFGAFRKNNLEERIIFDERNVSRRSAERVELFHQLGMLK